MTGSRPSVLYSGSGEIMLTGLPGSPEIDSVAAMAPAVASLLRRVRENQGLSLAEAAGRCGMSPSVLSRLERAHRGLRLRQLLALCNVLGVRFSDVMRAAEDEAFPLGDTPWTEHPAGLLAVRGPVFPMLEVTPEATEMQN